MTTFLSGIRMRSNVPVWFPTAPTLWLGNLGNEHMVDCLALDNTVTHESVQFAVTRLLWLLRREDRALIPGRLDPEFLAYVSETRRTSLSPDQVLATDASLIGQCETRTTSLHTHLSQCRTRGIRNAFPYIYDRATMHLLHHHGLLGEMFDTPFMHAGGAESLNSKAQFRLLAASKDWPVPSGRICKTLQDFVEGVQTLATGTTRVIAKANMGVGGLGNRVLNPSTTADRREHVGAISAIDASTEDAVARIGEDLGLRPTHATAGEVVIEQHVEGATPLFAEFFIGGGAHGAPFLLVSGRINSDPIRSVLSGVTISPVAKELWMQPFLIASERVAGQLQQMGYRGLINIDGLIDRDGRCYLNEVNGRMGGSTHIDVIARRLLGPGWQDAYIVSTTFGECRLDLPTILHRLDAAGVAWRGTDNPDQGVVVVSNGGPGSLFVEYLTIARSTGTAEELDSIARRILFEAGALSTEPGVPGQR